MSLILTRTFLNQKATRILRSCRRHVSFHAVMRRTIRRLPHRSNSQYLKLIRTVTRSFSVDYNNPSQQLVEENSNLNYRIYYQYGLPTVEDIKEFKEFNDKIWYGQEGKEMVVKLKEMPK